MGTSTEDVAAVRRARAGLTFARWATPLMLLAAAGVGYRWYGAAPERDPLLEEARRLEAQLLTNEREAWVEFRDQWLAASPEERTRLCDRFARTYVEHPLRPLVQRLRAR